MESPFFVSACCSLAAKHMQPLALFSVLTASASMACSASSGADENDMTTSGGTFSVQGSTGGASNETPMSSGGTPATGSGGQAGNTPELDAPDNADALVAFLEAGNYTSWMAEAQYHESSGPHGNAVKVFYSPLAMESVLSGESDIRPGGAVVKELTSGGSLYGWGVYVRGNDSPGTAGYYFYELIKPTQVYGDAYDSSECTGCHTSDSVILSDLSLVTQ